MSETTAAVATPESTIKAPKVKNTPKPATKPSKNGKANTAPHSAPMPNGKSVHADLPTREPNWTPRRVAVIKAMRVLGAVSKNTARTASEIGAKAKTIEDVNLAERVDLVKIILDVYRASELLHNGFAASCKNDGDRELRYFLTVKGQKTAFPVKAAK